MALIDFFIVISFYNDKLISIPFFPQLGVDPTVVLPLKEEPNGTHPFLNRTMVKKMMKEMEEDEKSQQKNQISMAEIWTHDPCLQSQALYPLDHSALPWVIPSYLRNRFYSPSDQRPASYHSTSLQLSLLRFIGCQNSLTGVGGGSSLTIGMSPSPGRTTRSTGSFNTCKIRLTFSTRWVQPGAKSKA